MNFVFLNQYYPPDAAPTGMMLARVVEELVEAGHEVTVICAKGGYASKESGEDDGARITGLEASGARIMRVGATSFGRGTFLGKLVDYVSFYLGVAWALATLSFRGSTPERIVAMTTPPYLSLLARFFSKFHGADHAHWVMDLYPDVMVAHGMLKSGGICSRFLGALTRWGFGGDRCACVLSLGPDMAERVASYLGPEEKSPWVPLWSGATIDAPDAEKVSELRAARGWADDELVLMYSGNMGLGHLFDEILTVARGKVESIKQKAGIGKAESRKLKVEMGEGVGKVESRKQKVEMGEEGMGQMEDGRWKMEDGKLKMEDGKQMGKAESRKLKVEMGEEGMGKVESRKLKVEMGGEGMGKMEDGRWKMEDGDVRFVFYGGGKRRVEVERYVASQPEAPVELHDYVAQEDLDVHLASADVHLVSLRPEWDGTMVPSKLQGVFAIGRPVIFIGSETSSLGQWVLESGGGWVVQPGDVGALQAAITEASDAVERVRRGQLACDYGRGHFEGKVNAGRVAELLVGQGHE